MDDSAIVDVATLDGPAASPARGSSLLYYAEEEGSVSPVFSGEAFKS